MNEYLKNLQQMDDDLARLRKVCQNISDEYQQQDLLVQLEELLQERDILELQMQRLQTKGS